MSRELTVWDCRLTTRRNNDMAPKLVGTHINMPDWPAKRILEFFGIAEHLKAELREYVDGKPTLTVIQEGTWR